MRHRHRRAGQSLAEFGIVLPILIFLILGMIELGWTLYQSQVAAGIAREGSNLISRNVTIQAAQAALVSLGNVGPVRTGASDPNTKVFLSVIKLGTSGNNNSKMIISQRFSWGGLTANSRLGNPAQSKYNSPASTPADPNYTAIDPVNDTGIQVSPQSPSPLPGNMTLQAGETYYVTEVYTKRTSIAPFLPLPATLYASAYF
jgi:Flp pilus assembly protein TadG